MDTEADLMFKDKRIKWDTNDAAYVPWTLHDSILSTLAKSGEISDNDLYYNFTDKNKMSWNEQPVQPNFHTRN